MPSLLSCCAMACLAQCAAGAKDALILLHTRAQKVGHQAVMEAEVESQGQSAGAPPFDVFDMRDQPKNRDHEGDCKWRCDNNDRCSRYVYNAITLYCKLFEESYSTPFDVFDMRDQKKNRDNQGDCKWRCDNNYQCERFEYDASTLFCKLFKKSEDDFNQSAPAFDVFDMRDHPKSRDHDGDCKWRCGNNHRCARYEFDASTLFCKMFEKSEDNSSQGAPPFDVFDMRDHPRNRNHDGDCKWRCGNNTRCARYEYDAITLNCKMFEKPKDQFSQDGKDTSGGNHKKDQVLVVDKSKGGFTHDSDQDDKETSDNNVKDDKGNEKSKQRLKRKSKQNDKGNKKSENGFKHDSEQDDKETSDKKAKNDKSNRKSKQRLKRKSDQNDKDDKDDKKSEKAFKQDSDQDVKDDKDVKGNKKSEKDINHDSDQDDKETSDNNAQDGNGKRKSKQRPKRNSDQDDKTKKEQEAETNPDLVSDNHDEHFETDNGENKKPKEKQESKSSSWRNWFR